jgi:hypothetical protein
MLRAFYFSDLLHSRRALERKHHIAVSVFTIVMSSLFFLNLTFKNYGVRGRPQIQNGSSLALFENFSRNAGFLTRSMPAVTQYLNI